MVTTGVLGGQWRASVSAWGAVEPWDGSDVLDWYVAADDRWHAPHQETSIRQTRVDGTPVVETRLRIPNGDAVHRVWSVADAGGMTLVEVANESPMPIAVAFTRSDVRSIRPPATVPIEGIDLPFGSIVFPIGHQATVMVAIAHDGSGVGTLPSVAPLVQVARAWSAMCDRASRFVVPDEGAVAAVVTARCELALCGPPDHADDPIGFLLAVDQLVRMGEPAAPWAIDIAVAVERVARDALPDWALDDALDAAARVLTAAGEQRGVRDLIALRSRVSAHMVARPDAVPAGVARVGVWFERKFAERSGALLPAGLPSAWLGAAIEVYGAPVGPTAAVSYALRWHGERPAVLWERTGAEVTLTAPIVAPQWSTTHATGEALWPMPPGADTSVVVVGEAVAPENTSPNDTSPDDTGPDDTGPNGPSLTIDGDGISFG